MLLLFKLLHHEDAQAVCVNLVTIKSLLLECNIIDDAPAAMLLYVIAKLELV